MFNETCAVLAHEVRRFTQLSWAGLFAGAFAITAANAALPTVGAPINPSVPQSVPAAAEIAPPLPVDETVETPILIAFGEPVPGHEVNSPFGLRRLPWERHARLHEGVDIAAPLGAAITAAADGVVTRAGYSASYGSFVEIRHAEGLTSFYAHMNGRARVRSGQAVKQGQRIGKVGNTGDSAGAHLHFEMHDEHGRPLNPARFIGQRFAAADELPIQAAARISPKVRLAYVSRASWPNSATAKAAGLRGRLDKADVAQQASGRVSMRIETNGGEASTPSAGAAPGASGAQPYTVIASDAAA